MPGNDALRQRLQSTIHVLNNHRVSVYAVASVAAVLGVVANALKSSSNFYSVAIYLSKSSRSVLALANFCFLIALLCGHLVQRLLFGPLRANEVERLYDRLWFFITESLLAFTIFRDEFDASFGFMFGFLLFVKSFHWLASDRIEWMDQRPYPGPPLLFHVRMATLFAILWVTDLAMFILTVERTLADGVGIGGMVLFASEYGILIASIMNSISKYLLSAYELRRAGQRGGETAPPWENKSMWTFYIELVTDFMKLSVYLVFFAIIFAFYGLPLNIIRDVYITARSFITRLRALHRYQTATRNMDQRYPNASAEELAAMSDHTCIICREEMVLQEPRDAGGEEGPNMSPKKLPCGHIFHFFCLRSWLERQQSCPTCRRTVFEDTPATGEQTNPPHPAPGQVPQAAPGFMDRNQQQQGGIVNPQANPANAAYGPRVNVGAPGAPNIHNPMNARLPDGVRAHPTTWLIQYEVQHYGQRGLPTSPLQGAQPLRPVPQFQGHFAPDGRWQPWPASNNRQGQPERPATEGSASVPSQSQPASSAEQDASTSRELASSADAESGAPVNATPSAREAARDAALRRFNLSNAPRPPSATTVASAPTPTRTLPTSPTQLPTATSFSTGSPNRQQYPQAIPLYGLAFSPDPNEQATMIRYPGVPVPSPYPFGGAFSQAPPHSAAAQSPSLSSIPFHVTDEQLSAMDQLTREAIDERLRVLEGVSNTVYRCVDDLMRLRSALPATPSGSPPQPSGAQGEPVGYGGPSTSTSRRDEKRPETSEAAGRTEGEQSYTGN